MNERGVSDIQAANAIAKPLHEFEAKTDDQGRKAQKIVGRHATVVINPETGAIITAYKTGRKERKKYEADE